MITRQVKKARFNTSAGFTLLELLIVLFLLSLGYASLYSAGFGNEESDQYQQTIDDSREIIRYGRRLALAKGQPVRVTVTSNGIQLHSVDGSTAITSPLNPSQDYQVSSSYELSNGDLKLFDNTSVPVFYFDAQGRLTSKENPEDKLVPLLVVLSISITDDSDTDKVFLQVSNVTGELMPV